MIINDCVLEAKRDWSPYGSVEPPAGWPDVSRYGNNGVDTAAITWVQLPSGLWTKSFNGTTSLLTCGAGVSLANIWDGGGTLMVWQYAVTDGEGDRGRIFNKGAINLGWNLHNREARLWLQVAFDGTQGTWRYTPQSYTYAAWHFIVITYNSDAVGNNPIFYQDGAVVASQDSTTPVGTRVDDAAQTLLIGNDAGTTFTEDGLLVLPRLNKVIATPDQVNAKFASERHLFDGA